jgi:hypothetical protein
MSLGLPAILDPRARKIGPDTALDQSSIVKFLREVLISLNFNFARIMMHWKEHLNDHGE